MGSKKSILEVEDRAALKARFGDGIIIVDIYSVFTK